jgi:hypothetical protein
MAIADRTGLEFTLLNCSDYKPYNHNFHGHIFQSGMWRKYAMMWDKPGSDRDWVNCILKISREECLHRSRIHIEIARGINR